MLKGNSQKKMAGSEVSWKKRAALVLPRGMFGHQAVHGLPSNYPQFYSRAEGCKVWDLDGKEYIDLLCGYGPNILGYGDQVGKVKAVERAVAEQMELRDTATGPGTVMVELAEKLVGITPGADWAIFAKNGNDSTQLALTVARAATGRKKVLVQPRGYHGASPVWSPGRPGVLKSDHAEQVDYEYNNLSSLLEAAAACEDDLAAVIVGAFDYRYSRDLELPTEHFAKGVRELCDRTGALLVVDDVRAGFRLGMSGSWHALHGVEADLHCYSKAISNGHALSALVGSARCRREGAEKVFATGSFWFSSAAQAAALTTICELEKRNAIEEMTTSGLLLTEGLKRQADSFGLQVVVSGPPTMPFLTFGGDEPYDRPRAMTFCEAACSHGVLLHPHHNWFLSLAHTSLEVEQVLRATEKAMEEVKRVHGGN